MMAKELDFWNCKLALLLIDNQSGCPKAAENFLLIFLMLLHGLATMMSSRQTETKGSPARIQSIIHVVVEHIYLLNSEFTT
jgi:hypothetical protein